MSRVFVVCGFFIVCLLWRQLASPALRSKLIPWALAVLLMNLTCGAFYWGPFRAIYAFSNFIAYAIMCDGLWLGKKGRNAAWTAFLTFFAYLSISTLFGYYPFEGLVYWAYILITSFCCGYYVARWMVRTEGAVTRLTLAVSCVSVVILYLYWKHGAMMMVDEQQYGGLRGGFDESTLAEGVVANVNGIAGAMLSCALFLVLGIAQQANTRLKKILKIVCALEMILAVIVLIRAGSRGALIGFVPVVWYYLFPKLRKAKVGKRVGFAVILLLVIGVGVRRIMGSSELRAFDFKVHADSYATTVDSLTTGRMSMWKNHIARMDTVEKLVGAGMFIESKSRETGRVGAGNAHSLYMTVFYNSGLVGLVFLSMFLVTSITLGLRMKNRGHMALMFIGTWMLTGLGESAGMTGTFYGVLCGFGIGLLTKGYAFNSELGERVPFRKLGGVVR